MFDVLHNFLDQVRTIGLDALVVGYIVIFVVVCITTRFSVKAIVILLATGVLALWIANNSDWLKQKGDETVDEIDSAPATAVLMPYGLSGHE